MKSPAAFSIGGRIPLRISYENEAITGKSVNFLL